MFKGGPKFRDHLRPGDNLPECVKKGVGLQQIAFDGTRFPPLCPQHPTISPMQAAKKQTAADIPLFLNVGKRGMSAAVCIWM